MDEQHRKALLDELDDRAEALRSAIEQSGGHHTEQTGFVKGQLDGLVRAALLLGIDRDLLRGYVAELETIAENQD